MLPENIISSIYKTVVEAETLYGRGQGSVKAHYVLERLGGMAMQEAANALDNTNLLNEDQKKELLAIINMLVSIPKIQKALRSISSGICGSNCFR